MNYEYELLIDNRHYGVFVLWSSALREAEYHINEGEIDLDEIKEIRIVKREIKHVQDH